MGAGTNSSNVEGGICIVYSKRTAKLVNSVALTPDGKSANVASGSNLRSGGDVELGGVTNQKTGRQRFRWNLIFNLLIWIIVPIPTWLPFLENYLEITLSLYVINGIQAAIVLFWLVVSICALNTLRVLYSNRKTDFKSKLHKKDYPNLHHLAVISCYKEPVELIAATVETLANQTIASDVTMVVSFEERTPDLRNKQGHLCDLFGQRFHEIIFTIHPFGTEGEIPGKCSNANCGIRTAMAHVKRRNPDAFDPDRIIVTTCDADSKFHPRYMEALSYKYATTKGAKYCIFQAPLLYNWNLDASCFITRVTGLVRAFLMMGALIPFNINSMSIFSFSSSLCIAGDFIHPAYQMDDIIALIRWMGVCKKRLRIVCIPVPVISGPTSGRVIEEEVEEWARQARRWTIGAGEVFHYFMVKSWGIPFFTAVSWGVAFFLYYGVILCCSSLYGVVSLICYFTYEATGIIEGTDLMFWLTIASVAYNYVVFAIIFIVDRLAVRLTEPRIEERISLVRQIFQWLLSPFVLLGYSVVEFVALHEMMIRGKKVCKHGASKKDALKA